MSAAGQASRSTSHEATAGMPHFLPLHAVPFARMAYMNKRPELGMKKRPVNGGKWVDLTECGPMLMHPRSRFCGHDAV